MPRADGSGRQLGQKDTKPRQTPARKQAALAASEGITPLEVMLRTMRAEWHEAERITEAGDLDDAAREKAKAHRSAACQQAREAAPYVHARLATTTINASIRRSARDFPDADLVAIASEDGGEDGIEPPEGIA